MTKKEIQNIKKMKACEKKPDKTGKIKINDIKNTLK